MTMPMKPWDWRDAVYSARFTCSPNWFEATSSRRPVDSFQLIAQLPPGRQPDRQTLLATEHLPEHPLCHPLRQSIPMNRSFSCPFTTHPFLSMAQRVCVYVCVCQSNPNPDRNPLVAYWIERFWAWPVAVRVDCRPRSLCTGVAVIIQRASATLIVLIRCGPGYLQLHVSYHKPHEKILCSRASKRKTKKKQQKKKRRQTKR